ncbi:hypothetical protein [Sorangium sp. So ce693]|uniref:hypothetical protein n=1 Tax=Sorangium sp. So ce693 TaxID=3133318 RepID=UPI003F5E3D5D
MSSLGAPVTALLGTCLFALGCVVTPAPAHDNEEDIVAEEDVASVEQAYVFPNGDDPVFFWEPRTIQMLQRLAMAPLADAAGKLASTPLLETAQGRKLLHYVVGCALRPDMTVKGVVGASSYVYQGALGLAAPWRSQAMTLTSPQRWVTACLLQTLNGFLEEVPIRMVGKHPGLADAPWMNPAQYTFPDATMFGNIFVPGQEVAYACADEGAQLACGDLLWSQFANLRICDSLPTCKLTLLGPCKGSLPNETDCTTNAAGQPTCHADGVSYPESISSKLDAEGIFHLYPSCGQ